MEASINGIVIGIVIAFVLMMIGMILFKVFSKSKDSGETVIKVLEEYQDNLIEIAELCIDLVSKNKEGLSQEEYNQKILELTADYFRAFLKRETKIPKVLIDLITADHMFDIIDYINTISKMQLKNAVSEADMKEKDIDEEVKEDPYITACKELDKKESDELVDVFKDNDDFF